MAGTSTIYESQTKQLPIDLQYWQTYIELTAAVIETFNDSMYIMQQQIDALETSIDSLIIRTTRLEDNMDLVQTALSSLGEQIEGLTPYVRLSTSGIELESGNVATYTKSIGIFTNQNTIYVYSNKSIDGVSFNSCAIKAMAYTNSDKSIENRPFTSFAGSDQGIQKQFITSNAPNTSGLKLYFSDQALLDNDAMENAAILDVKIIKKITATKILTSTRSINTSIQAAIDRGINQSGLILSGLITKKIDANLTAIKSTATKSSTAAITVPKSITTIATAANVAASKTAVTVTSRTTATSNSTSSASKTPLVSTLAKSATTTTKSVSTVIRNSGSTVSTKRLR